jgi:hypothetical protein
VVVSAGDGFGLAGVFADVLDRGVAIKDGLQVDVDPPSQQDRFGVMTEVLNHGSLQAEEDCLREPDSASSTEARSLGVQAVKAAGATLVADRGMQ